MDVQFLDLKLDMDKLLFPGKRHFYIFFSRLIFIISFNSYSQISLPTFYGIQAKNNASLELEDIILYFDAGNPSSYPGNGNTWYDLTSNNNDGTLVNGPIHSFNNGGYFYFDGLNDFVTTTLSISGWNAFTFEIWVKYTSTGSREGIVGQNDAVEFGFINSSTIQLWTAGDGSLNWGINNNSLPSNTWHHIVAIGTGSKLKLYVNGIQKVSVNAGNGTYASSNYKFNIARGVFDGSGNYFNGHLAVVRVYDDDLTDDEILKNIILK